MTACEACEQEAQPPDPACNTYWLDCKAVRLLKPSEQIITSGAVLYAPVWQPSQRDP